MYIRGSYLQRCLSSSFAPFVTHYVTLIVVFVVFAGLTTFAGWASTQVVTEFKVDLIYKDGHRLERYNSVFKQYYPKSGSTIVYFTDQSIDVMTKTNQESYLRVMSILKGEIPCDYCDKNWVLPGTLNSWYLLFRRFTLGGCPPCTTGAGPGVCLDGQAIEASIVAACLPAFYATSGAVFVNTTTIYYNGKILSSVSLFT